LSKYLDDVYDEAYNALELEGGIDGVRWGRIDYVNVTFLTTKWAIWQYAASTNVILTGNLT
jgi:hypothetical protein